MNARLSPEREAEIAARHEAAAPGPWSANAQIGVVTNEAGDPLAVFGGGEQDRADAAFVAAAREDVPALLAELAAVRAERDQARERIAELENPQPRKRPNTDEEFSRQGARVVCRDCKWTSPWFDTTNEYGAFKSASIFHTCETGEPVR